MAFEKPSHSEIDTPADSEASSKKGKTKKKSGEVRGAAEKLPPKIPLEIEAQTASQKSETEPKTGESRKKKRSSKKSKKPATTLEQTPVTSTVELPKLGAHESTEKPKKAAEGAGEKASVADEAIGVPIEHDTSSADTAEEIILPHQVDGEEGELFVSDRLKASTETAQLGSEAADEGEIEDGDDEDTSRNNSAASSASTSRPTTTSTPRRSAPTQTAAAATASTGGGGTTPPNTPRPTRATHTSGNGGRQTPPLNNSVAATSGGYNAMPATPNRAANTISTPERTSKRPSAERRSIAAGIIIGGVIEHIRHKRREKRIEKAHTKEVKGIKKEHAAEKVRNEQKTSREKTFLEQKIERLKKEVAVNPVVKKEANKPEATPPTLEQHLKSAYMPKEFAQEKSSIATKPLSPEVAAKPRAVAVPEKIGDTDKRKKVPQVNPEAVEQVEVPEDRRVESSAWHRIEVDKKTGKAIEDPSIAYGHEFQNEQHQEQLRKTIADASIEAEKVKEAYMPNIPKAGVSAASNPLHQAQPASPLQPAASSSDAKPSHPALSVIKKTKDTASNKEPIDIILWIVLFVVFGVIAIIL